MGDSPTVPANMHELDLAQVSIDKEIEICYDEETGSFQNNEQHQLGETYKGEYIYPSGTKYIGEMKDEQFHGNGTLFFTDGSTFTAEFTEGRALKNGKYVFTDGLEYIESLDWDYCNGDDRRFYDERFTGLEPARRENIHAKDRPGFQKRNHKRQIPEGALDTRDGFYITGSRTVYNYNGEFLRSTDQDEHEWILKYCKRGWDDFVGKKETWRMN